MPAALWGSWKAPTALMPCIGTMNVEQVRLCGQRAAGISPTDTFPLSIFRLSFLLDFPINNPKEPYQMQVFALRSSNHGPSKLKSALIITPRAPLSGSLPARPSRGEREKLRSTHPLVGLGESSS